MKNINLSLNDELYQKINDIAATFFNNNRNKAVITILEASLNSNIDLEINGNPLPINMLLEIPSPSKIDLSKLNGVFKDTFKRNFFMLEKPLQDSLYDFLLYMQKRYDCTFGTASNISVYLDKKLCFYINISGYRGNVAIEDYLKALKKNANHSNLNYKVYDGKKIDFPRNTVWLSRKDQFIRNSYFDPSSTSDKFFKNILNRLSIPAVYSAIEITASEMNALINHI